MSPLAGVAALDLLCARHYRPVEISNVLYRPVENPRLKTAPISECVLRARKRRNSGPI